MHDLIIIGAGPAGLTAAIYGIRAGLSLVVIEKLSPGGQVINTNEVENYPGFVDPIPGWELMSAMENQARRLGAEIQSGVINEIRKDNNSGSFHVILSEGRTLDCKSVLVATGTNHKKLNIPGESELLGRGVSFCATCDGAFYKDKITAVIGGGNTALEDADYLTRFASRVYLIHRRDQFRGAKILQNRVLSNNKIDPVYDTVVHSINGDNGVESLSLINKKTNESSELKVDGVFVLVGFEPNTAFLPNEILNEKGEVIVDMQMRTPIEGLFAAGDMRENSRRQIVMAAADGATAGLSAYEYIVSS
ncbi:MAG: thioredoxin-disulfide reductase [Spirochaetota bacterium]|nr:thioredoxin-disulfide reductase [Spirochaetota bacterium]